jgi:thymidylate synthase ThyX
MQYNYISQLSIASVSNEDSNVNRNKVFALLQNPARATAAIKAYLGARYSRSDKSIIEIAEEISDKNINADERLANIFHGYGHTSVADMADIFLCLENIPMITAQMFWYNNNLVSGQERSTRYQDFKHYEFPVMKLSSKINEEEILEDLELKYENIMNIQMAKYREMILPTRDFLVKKYNLDTEIHAKVIESRTLDCTRQLIPMGVNTNVAALMNARNWSKEISRLLSSDQQLDADIAILIQEILTDPNKHLSNQGYIPESPGLIRYVEKNNRNLVIEKLLSYFHKDLLDSKVLTSINYSPNCRLVKGNFNLVIRKLLKLIYPNKYSNEYYYTYFDSVLYKIASCIVENFDDRLQGKSLLCSGDINIEGYTDLGSLKDLNRHRSIGKFIPLFENSFDIEKEISNPEYILCKYLESSKLETEYSYHLDETYKKIKEWYKLASKYLEKNELLEYIRYTLPHAHSTKYIFSGDIDDFQYIINLRTRPGGHINYRVHVYEWLELLADTNLFFFYLKNRIKKPNPNSLEEFLDRS